jgi:hypothetical protein
MTRRTKLIVWLAMLWAIVMYCVVMRLLPAPSAPRDNSLDNVLLAASVALAGASLAIRSRFLVAVILCDAAAAMGLVSWFVTGSPRSFYCLVPAILAMLVHFPGEKAGSH